MAYDYCVLRIVPRIDRGEFLNVGVVVYCQAQDLLACATHLDTARLLAVFPGLDLAAVGTALAGVQAVCVGQGRPGAEPLRVRFGWLTSPRSTLLQPGPVHGGMSPDASGEAERLVHRLVQ